MLLSIFESHIHITYVALTFQKEHSFNHIVCIYVWSLNLKGFSKSKSSIQKSHSVSKNTYIRTIFWNWFASIPTKWWYVLLRCPCLLSISASLQSHPLGPWQLRCSSSFFFFIFSFCICSNERRKKNTSSRDTLHIMNVRTNTTEKKK